MINSDKQPYWYLYMIETKHKSLYTGISLDWKRRFNEHQLNSYKTAKALKGKGPLTLKYVARLNNKNEAMKAEIWVKKQNKQQKTKVIQNKISIPFEHSLCRINV